MWELLVNDSTLEVGNRLRHRIIIDENQEIIQEFKIISVDTILFSANMTIDNGIDIPIEKQISWFNKFDRLDLLGLEKWVE